MNELSRPKRFVAALILRITNLISILASLATSTSVLVQEIHTANHVNDLSQNVSVALSLQERLGKKLETTMNALEDTVLYIGNQIQNIQTQMTARCHSQYKWICITPYPYDNTTEPWDKVKAHLQGIWHNTELAPDLHSLQEKIKDLSQAKLHLPMGESIAQSLWQSLRNTVDPTMWWSNLVHIGITVLIKIILYCYLPSHLQSHIIFNQKSPYPA